MGALNYWRMSESLSTVDATLLIIGELPENWHTNTVFLGSRNFKNKWPNGYEALINLMEGAIVSGKLKAVKHHDERMALSTGKSDLDLAKTIVKMSDLRAWVKSKGIETEFFPLENDLAQEANSRGAYLDDCHPLYAHKLAAAIEAWEAVANNPSLLRNKSPKQALEKWLIRAAPRLNLLKPDGGINKLAINEIAKIANWAPQGGIPKTPG